MANALVMLLSKRQAASQETTALIRRMLRTFGWLTHPGAVLVLISGIIMIVDMNWDGAQKPLWLNYMERGGGVIILASIVLTAIWGRSMSKRLQSTQHDGSAVAVSGSLYITSLLLILAAILSVILVVSFRL